MSQHDGKRLGSVNYYGYGSLSDAFYSMPVTAQAVFMSILANHPGESPIVVIPIPVLADAMGVSAMDAYRTIGAITGKVIVESSGGVTYYTSMAISVIETFDGQGDPISVTLVVPASDHHKTLMDQFDEVAVHFGIPTLQEIRNDE
jgi:hypothetical protein